MAADPCLLILAAGFSRRFDADKRFARLPNGRSFLEQALAIAEASGVNYRLVLRSDDALATNTPEILLVTHAERGMGQSIAEAVAQAPVEASAVLLLPVDLVCLSPATVWAVAERAATSSIVRPCCQGRFGHPVAFGRNFYPALMALTGDRGARSVIDAHKESVVRIDVEDVGVYRDIDTPQALSTLTSEELF